MTNRYRSGTGAIALLVFVCALAGGLVARWLPFEPRDVQRAEQPTGAGAGLAMVTSLPELVRRTAPAVVNISVLQPSPALQNPLLRDPFFRRYFGVPDSALEPTIAAGSGVIVDGRRGVVVTNFHVIENASAVEIGLQDKRNFRAQVIGVDPALDLAVLHVTGRHLPSLALGNSYKLSVGDTVLAIGNPFGLGQTVTAGIVSATDRAFGGETGQRFIQTDAPITPGNSGGPLIDTRGEVIGINSALISPNQGNVGIGFAIPANKVRQVLDQALRTM
jgi:S1-C subfamily serine protease